MLRKTHSQADKLVFALLNGQTLTKKGMTELIVKYIEEYKEDIPELKTLASYPDYADLTELIVGLIASGRNDIFYELRAGNERTFFQALCLSNIVESKETRVAPFYKYSINTELLTEIYYEITPEDNPYRENVFITNLIDIYQNKKLVIDFDDGAKFCEKRFSSQEAYKNLITILRELKPNTKNSSVNGKIIKVVKEVTINYDESFHREITRNANFLLSELVGAIRHKEITMRLRIKRNMVLTLVEREVNKFLIKRNIPAIENPYNPQNYEDCKRCVGFYLNNVEGLKGSIKLIFNFME